MTAPVGKPSPLRRRHLLTVLGGGGAALLAGCSGGAGETGGDGSGTDGEGTGTDDPGTDDGGEDGGGEGNDVSCPEWSSIERVDLAEHSVEDFPVVPSYPAGWEETNAYVESDESILAVADPEREAGNSLDYVSVQVRLVDAEGEVPSRTDWPTRDWTQADEDTDPVAFEGEERPVGIFEGDIETIWEFTAAGPNDTHMLVNVIVRFASEDCRAGMDELGREVLDTLELNEDSSI